MKKILLGIVLLVLLAPLAQAATLYSQSGNVFHYNEANGITPIDVGSDKVGEITKANGIRILIGSEHRLLWDRVDQVTVTGKAVSQGYMAETVVPEYSTDYKAVYFPVLKDWPADISANISGLRFRAYTTNVGPHDFLGLDTTGDSVADVYDSYEYSVIGTGGWLDRTAPYPPTDIKSTISLNPAKVALSWKRPPDYDWTGTRVYKTVTHGGLKVVNQDMILDRTTDEAYEDTKVQAGDEVFYEFFSVDASNNLSESVDVVLRLAEQVTPEPITPPAPETPTEPQVSSELSQLTQLFGYYKVRQAIKCREGVNSGDSGCLWARIDLIYAQKLLGRSDVSISLTARDLELIALRIVWPESRYQTKCVEATTPDKSCPALEKSIKRAHYFID